MNPKNLIRLDAKMYNNLGHEEAQKKIVITFCIGYCKNCLYNNNILERKKHWAYYIMYHSLDFARGDFIVLPSIVLEGLVEFW